MSKYIKVHYFDSIEGSGIEQDIDLFKHYGRMTLTESLEQAFRQGWKGVKLISAKPSHDR